MAIEKIEVKNLTAFSKMEMDIGADVNVIIGENGTGKTHLLKFIYTISQLLTGEEVGLQSFFGTKPQTEELILLRDKSKDKASFSFWHGEELIQYYLYNSEQIKPDNNVTGEKTKIGFSRPVRGSNEKWSEIVKYNLLEDELKQLIKKFVFIPAKDMLTHSVGLPAMKVEHGSHMPFDKSLINIINKATKWKKDEIPNIARSIVPKLEKIMDGKVVVENERFFIIKESNAQKIPFDVEAEGVKKIGLLWQLLMNGSIDKGTVLLWDEPESNINPKLIPILAEIILELGRNGVQIFLATHDYFLTNYIKVLTSENDSVAFHSLYKTGNGTQCETVDSFSALAKNDITDEELRLYEYETEKGLE